MDNFEVIIRDYTKEDLPAITELTVQLGYPTTINEMESRMEDIAKETNYKTIIAVVGKEVAGYMGLHKAYFWEQNGHFIRIQALVVNSRFRNKHVGRKLIEHAESWARQIKATSIMLNCGNRPERENAHAFYVKMGFAAKSTGYRKDIDLYN